jgi:hypothetical protein
MKESELRNSIITFGGGPKKERKKVISGILSSFLAGDRRKKVSSGILSSFLAGDRRKKVSSGILSSSLAEDRRKKEVSCGIHKNKK